MHKVCIRYVYFLHQVCITIPLADHKSVHQVCQMHTLQTWCTLDSACHWLLGAVGGPAHDPRADVVDPAAGTLPPVLVAFPQRKELPLAASQRRRNGATMQRVGHWHPVRHLSPLPDIALSPPPDIALEIIGQTTLGLLTSRPVEVPGSNQHGSVPFTPRRSCKTQSTVKKFATGDNKKTCA
jgi:hypothetical protein